jgi:hypothetical protein
MYLSVNSVKRLKSAFGNKSICAMGIISYPELAYILYLKEVRDIFHKYNKQIKAFCVMNKSRKSKYLLVTNEL